MTVTDLRVLRIENALDRAEIDKATALALKASTPVEMTDRIALAEEVRRVREELHATQEALDEAEREVETLQDALRNINHD
jgi:fructose-specific phosphotransferase system component IIB